MFFSSEKEPFSWTYLLKKTPRRTKVLTSPVWNEILKFRDTLFEFKYIVVNAAKISLNFFLQQEAGAFGSNTGKEPQNPRPKFKNMYIIDLLRIFTLPAI